MSGDTDKQLGQETLTLTSAALDRSTDFTGFPAADLHAIKNTQLAAAVRYDLQLLRKSRVRHAFADVARWADLPV